MSNHHELCECCQVYREIITIFQKHDVEPQEAIKELTIALARIAEHEGVKEFQANYGPIAINLFTHPQETHPAPVTKQ